MEVMEEAGESRRDIQLKMRARLDNGAGRKTKG
jgi:hypothetical protein